MRYAIIENNKVINVIEATPQVKDQLFPAAILLADNSPVGVNWGYSGGNFTPPPIVKYVPPEVTMRQARLALHAAGLLNNVATAINGLTEPAKTQAQIEWEYSNSLVRSNPFVATLGGALGLTSDQIDDLFIAASQIP